MEARVNLGSVLVSEGDRAGAAGQLREALRLDPSNVTAHFNLGSLLAGSRRGTADLEAVVAARPEDAEARRLLAQALRDGGISRKRWSSMDRPSRWRRRLVPQAGRAETLVRLAPLRRGAGPLGGRSEADAHERTAEPRPGPLLASCPDPSVRDGARALALAQAVWQAQPTADHARTVALALGELGRCREAAG